MVFKPFTHLPRQIFSKTFAHGYAQSVVAASQTSYATTTTSLGLNHNYPVGKLGRTAQLQNTYQSTSSSSGPGAKFGGASSSNASGNDGGLAAYYAAWQHAQTTGDDSEWRNHQLQRRLGWKGPGAVGQTARRDSSGAADSLRPRRPTLARPHSANVVHDLKKTEDGEVTTADGEVVSVDPADIKSTEVTAATNEAENASLAGPNGSPAPSVGPESIFSAEDSTASVSDASVATSEHIVQLAKSQQYAEIPAVFHSTLSQGIVPSIDAYNALLVAAINLPADSEQAFSKVLDVRADMIRRGVKANIDTHAIIVQFLANRALQANLSKNKLRENQKRYGGLHGRNSFLFLSSALEFELLAEDDSLSLALKQFRTGEAAFPNQAFPAGVYESLIKACAQTARVDEMCEVYNSMNSQQKCLGADAFSEMIQAFEPSANLGQAVQAYENYKNLAISSNAHFARTRTSTSDYKAYAALIKNYVMSGQEARGFAFYDDIVQSFESLAENRSATLAEMQSVVVPEGIIAAFANLKAYQSAFDWLSHAKLVGNVADKSFMKICVQAADANEAGVAQEAFGALTPAAKTEAAPIMLAMALRGGDLETARSYWQHISSLANIDRSLLQPITMYSMSLIANNALSEGLGEARKLLARIEKTSPSLTTSNVRDEIAEAILKLDQTIINSGILPSAIDCLALLRTMVENDTLVPSVAEHSLAPIGPNDIQGFASDDLKFLLHMQGNAMLKHAMVGDNGSVYRFACLLETLMGSGKEFDSSTVALVRDVLPMVSMVRPDLSAAFEAYLRPAPLPTTPATTHFGPAQVARTAPVDTFDPYAHNTDFRGSSVIAEQLESITGRGDSILNDALTRFKNMRRIGRHPRYITYAKMITAAARAGKRNIVEDILNMACTDVSYLEQYPVVKHGWVSILDSMVAAYLTLGDRSAAAQTHQDLLAMGATPSANTFGLYITTLKESTRTFDEATEAVKIFQRAVAEGVEPTSFLYNALIGKLGKARRIDDCLQYFAEMRAQNIRPTSVTYGTIVNALCRVSDERFAEEMFDEMESMPNYKPRPAPYNSMIQYFLNTKRDRTKVMAYYERMRSKNIQPTMHTYKLLIDAYASLEPVDMSAAEKIIQSVKASGQQPEAVHYASLIHAKGCVVHDMAGAKAIFDSVLAEGKVQPQPCLYQALFEALVANHQVADTEALLEDMSARRVEMTPYIANTLIHGWAAEGNLAKAQAAYNYIGQSGREPSTYEAMTRAFLSSEDHQGAARVANEMLQRGYPSAVAGKILELVGGGNTTPVTV